MSAPHHSLLNAPERRFYGDCDRRTQWRSRARIGGARRRPSFFVAGTLATIALTFTAPLLASLALSFGPAEYFALTVVAFTTVSVLLGASLLRGIMSLFVGLALGLIGIDPLTGTARFSLGLPQLLDGIDVMILVIGLFAVGETLFQVLRRQAAATVLAVNDAGGMTGDDWRRSWKPWLRGTAIGFPLGVLPCGGAEIPTFLSYMIEKRLSARPEEFGHGAIEGVAGPEAANNAAAAGVLVPLLTLGLPASATAAVLLSAFQQYGLQPGPLLFTARPDLVWTLIASLYIGNVMLLVLNLPLARVWARICWCEIAAFCRICSGVARAYSLIARGSPRASLWVESFAA